MKILLLSMPDSFEHMPEPVVRMPNGALTSLAGNVDPHMAAEEVEFMRSKAERWMNLRHVPAALLHNSRFMLANWPRILAHTFRGSSLKSVFGLQKECDAFQRYRAIR